MCAEGIPAAVSGQKEQKRGREGISLVFNSVFPPLEGVRIYFKCVLKEYLQLFLGKKSRKEEDRGLAWFQV